MENIEKIGKKLRVRRFYNACLIYLKIKTCLIFSHYLWGLKEECMMKIVKIVHSLNYLKTF